MREITYILDQMEVNKLECSYSIAEDCNVQKAKKRQRNMIE
jgi:hypothetical protein